MPPENPTDFLLQSEYIALDNLLKVLGVVDYAAQSKELISRGLVKVNGVIEIQLRRKIRKGDLVQTGDLRVRAV